MIIGEETMMSLPQHLEQPHKATAATPTPTLPKEVVPTVMTIPPLSSTLSEHTTKNSDGSDDDDDDDSTVVIVGGVGNSVVISSSSSSSSNSSNANENNNDVYNVVKAARAVKASLRGAGDVNLVRRERELTYLRDYLTACRFADMPGCFYVSGPPGTGKTTAVIRVVSSLNIAAPGNWTVVNVDCIKLAKAGPAELFRGLSRQLELRCSKQQQQQQRAVEERLCRADLPPVVMIVDEADALFSRGVRRRLLFTIFTFPLLRGSRCIVIAVANASRPPASFWKKLRSRIGIWRVHFGPYSAEDLEAIAAARIASVPCSAEVITPTALHAIAVRLAVTCGDARRMLMLTCAAVDNALARITRSNNDSIGDNNNNNNNCPLVQKADVDAAVEEMLMADARSAGIATLPPHLAVLLAVVARRCSIFGVQLDQECVHPPRRDRGWAGVGEVVCDAVQAWAQFATPNAPGDSTQEVVLALRLLQQTGLVRMAAEARRGYTPPEMWKVQATIDQETLLASLKDQNAASMLLS